MTTKKPAPDLTPILRAIESLESEEGVPRSVKAKIENLKSVLNSSEDFSVKMSKCFSDLDEMSEDVNIPSYIKTHLWNLSGLLERLNS